MAVMRVSTLDYIDHSKAVATTSCGLFGAPAVRRGPRPARPAGLDPVNVARFEMGFAPLSAAELARTATPTTRAGCRSTATRRKRLALQLAATRFAD